MAHSKASPVRVRAAERRLRALELRKAGWTYQAIGKELGISEAQAHRIVTAELTRLNAQRSETAIQVAKLEVERLDELLRAVMPKATAGDSDAVSRALAIAARRAKLLGLDMPMKHEVTGQNGGPLVFSLEQAIAADKELENWERDRMQPGAGGAVDAGNPQVP